MTSSGRQTAFDEDRDSISDGLISLAEQRDPGKTFCPSEFARRHWSINWQSHMSNVRQVADELVDRGVLIATQRGELVDVAQAKGPIRLALHRDARDPATPCLGLLNLGPACVADLQRVSIETLAELRRQGALEAFIAIMFDKWHRGHRKNLFHSMYLYALWGALHDVNCMRLPEAIRKGLIHKANEVKRDCLGSASTR
ncbi:MAG: DUF3253 domain-containing protein [Planctomycetota bacterium]